MKYNLLIYLLRFIKKIGLSIANLMVCMLTVKFLLIGCSSNSSENPANMQQPNIIFILADDFGRELLSVYGGTSYDTPVLDRMSEQGLTFTDSYATPMCAPTRMMFLTGQYNFRNYDDWNEMNYDLKTVAHYMQDAGYVTGMAGKWHRGGWDLEPKGPRKAGFMNYSSFNYPEYNLNPFWGITIWQDGEPVELGKYDSSSDYFNNYLIEFIENNKDHPFFFYYPLNLVHRPFLPVPTNPDIHEAYLREKLTRNRGELEYFQENVAYLDKLIGRVLTTLEEQGLIDNTIVIFSGDNGTDNVQEARELRSDFKGQSVMGGKYFPTELGVNVPLIVYAPGFVSEARIVRTPVDFTDLLPTFYELSGFQPTENLDTDGLSFAPLLYGEDFSGREWIYSYGNFEHNSSKYKDPVNNPDAFYHVISNGEWKYYSDGRLFNVGKDKIEENQIPPGYSEESEAARNKLMYELERLRGSEPKLW